MVAAALTAGAAAATLGLTPASAATTANWVLTGWNIHQLNQLNPTLASHFFNTPRSYATAPTPAPPIADGFAATGVLAYNSYAPVTADLASHAIAPAYTGVMHHPEVLGRYPAE